MSVDAHSGDVQNTTISADDAEDLLEAVEGVLNVETKLHTETGETTHKNREFALIDVTRQLESLTTDDAESVDLSNVTPLTASIEKHAKAALIEYAEENDMDIPTDSLTEILKALSKKL